MRIKIAKVCFSVDRQLIPKGVIKMLEERRIRKLSRELFKTMDAMSIAKGREISLRLSLLAEMKKVGVDGIVVDGVRISVSSRKRSKINVDERLHNALIESGVFYKVSTVSAALVVAQLDSFGKSLQTLIRKRLIIACEEFLSIRGV